MNTFKIGKIGETLVEKYLICNRYSILEKNWYRYACELDFICWDTKKVLTFIEVKYVRFGFCFPEDLFTKGKRRRMARGVNLYLRENHFYATHSPYRIDLICLEGHFLRHYRNLSLW